MCIIHAEEVFHLVSFFFVSKNLFFFAVKENKYPSMYDISLICVYVLGWSVEIRLSIFIWGGKEQNISMSSSGHRSDTDKFKVSHFINRIRFSRARVCLSHKNHMLESI